MGRLDVTYVRYLSGEQFRVLVAVEMGMKNHELVPLPLVAAIAAVHRGAVARALQDLDKHSLISFERGKRYDGYRLTKMGYDYLALRALCTRDVVGSVGNQIGVGKESDVYVGGDPQLNDLCLKFHRLGRTSFRKIKEKRDYHKQRKAASWLYLSRLAAAKEFAFLKALSDAGFPVPRPVDVSRHVVVMGLIDGRTLCHFQPEEIQNVGRLYDKLMDIIFRLARYGLIHGDFNEFNLMIVAGEEPILIDFPQMVSMDHANARFYFERDVDCVRTFFKKRFNFECDEFPKFENMKRKHNLDVQLEASGFTKQMAKDLNKAYDEGDFGVCMGDGEEESGSEEEDEEEESDEDSEGTLEDVKEEEEQNEELKEEVDEKLAEGKMLGKSQRFMNWVTEASQQLEQLVVAEDEDCPPLVHPEKHARYLAHLEEQQKKLDEAEEEEEEEERDKEKKKSRPKGSKTISTTSTIPIEEIRRRVALETKRNKEKTKLRVKGRQSAVSRGRKNNRDVIREYAGWEF